MKLLETNSPQYLKRLVRELNQAGLIDGFYAPVATHVLRCNRARFRNGQIECRSPFASPEWFVPSSLHISDGNGREIVACRHIRH